MYIHSARKDRDQMYTIIFADTLYLIYLQIANVRKMVIVIIIAVAVKEKKELLFCLKIGTTHTFPKDFSLTRHNTTNWYI